MPWEPQIVIAAGALAGLLWGIPVACIAVALVLHNEEEGDG